MAKAITEERVTSFWGGSPQFVEAAVRAYENLLSMRAYIGDMVAARRVNPTDDIVGNMVAIEQEGERLSLDELVSTIVTFFVAGHDTTTNLISNGVYLFMQQPAVWAQLIEQPEQMKAAVEEVLRLEPSVPRMWRIAAEDVEIGGKLIKKGEMVFPMLSAANRDPNHFPDPDQLRLDRPNMRHVAFGFGIHYCIGAPLARLEGAIALRQLAAALPGLELAETPVWTEDIAIRRLEQLRLAL